MLHADQPQGPLPLTSKIPAAYCVLCSSFCAMNGPHVLQLFCSQPVEKSLCSTNLVGAYVDGWPYHHFLQNISHIGNQEAQSEDDRISY